MLLESFEPLTGAPLACSNANLSPSKAAIRGKSRESLFHTWYNRPMDLNDLMIFAKIVQAGSFTQASSRLNIPKSTVSRKVAELEERLGTRLLNRTTRTMSLTDAGQTLYDYALRILSEAEEAERAVTRLQEAPRGLLRVTAPLQLNFLGPVMISFLARYPEVQLELVCSEKVVNLVDERFDVGIRAGALADSSLISRKLGSLQRIMVASKGYLDRKGRPEHPAELREHDCLVFGVGNRRSTWSFQRSGQSTSVSFAPRLEVNDLEQLFEATVAGLGVSVLPVTRCAELVQSGKLELLLPEWRLTAIPLHAVYLSARHMSSKVRAFLDHLQENLHLPRWRPPVEKSLPETAREETSEQGSE